MPDYPKRFTEAYKENKYLQYPFRMSKDEKKLYQQYSFALEQYNDLVNYLNSTSEALDPKTGEKKGYGKNSFGFEKEMDEEITELLKEKVSNLLAAGQRLADTINVPEGTTPERRGLLFDIQQTINQCNRENSVLEDLESGEKLSYMAMHARSTEVIIDVGSDDLETEGASMSTRIKLRYMDESGKLRSGFFTEDTQTGHSIPFILKNARENAPGMSKLFDAIEKHFISSGDDGPDYQMLFVLADHLPSDSFSSAERMKEAFSDMGFDDYDEVSLDKLEPSAKDLRALKEMMTALADEDLENLQKLDEIMHLEEGNSFNQRNTAMSDMATALGMPKIVAKSTPMSIVKKGKTLHGCFMAHAEGLDFNDIKPENELLHGEEFSINYDSALTDATNLMVLDYICCNGDRHQNNMFYKISQDKNGNPVLNGFQGIDNDLSFGDIVPKENAGVKLLPPLIEIKMMKKETADRVMSMTEDKIKGILSGRGLSQKELDACWGRTQKMQKLLSENKITVVDGKFTEGDWLLMERQVIKRNNLNRNHVDPIKNAMLAKQIFQDKVEELEDNGADIYKEVAKQKKRDLEKRIKDGLKNLKNKVYIDEKMTIKNQSAQVKKLFSKLKAPGNSDMPEYRNLYNRLKDLNDTLKEYKKSDLSADIKGNILAEKFKKTQRDIRSYISALPENLTKNDGKRMSIAQSLNSVCTNAINSRERQVNELNTLMANSAQVINEANKAFLKAVNAKDPFEEMSAKMALEAKIHLSSYVGNVQKPERGDLPTISNSFAKILVVGKLNSMKLTAPAAYQEIRKNFESDDKLLSNTVANVMKTAEFKSLIGNVNPINALANNTISEMNKLANDMGIFEKAGMKTAPDAPSPKSRSANMI